MNITSLQRVYNYLKSKSEPYGGYYFLLHPYFIPIDLDLIKQITTRDFEYFYNRYMHTDESDPLSSHLVALKGAKWKHMRTKLSPAFTSAKNKMVIPVVIKCIESLTEILDEITSTQKSIEMKKLNGKLLMNVIAACAFGLEINALKQESEFEQNAIRYFDTTLKVTIQRFLTMFFPDILSLFKIRSIREDVGQFFLRIVQETIKYREENDIIRSDFMHLLIQIRNNVKIDDNQVGGISSNSLEKKTLTISEIASQCLMFFMAGYESSSSTVTFCLYELSLNQELQEKARKEIENAVAKHKELNYDAIEELDFLNKCIKETLRKYPTGTYLSRQCTKDYKIPNTNLTIEKGTAVLIPVFAMHRDPELYPEPDKFDPERFSEENINKRHPSAWIPFGLGPRLCIGDMIQMNEVENPLECDTHTVVRRITSCQQLIGLSSNLQPPSTLLPFETSTFSGSTDFLSYTFYEIE
ncbi:hypothetical protein RN001_006812 [Aquatica leii]|uniref:Cytochrome P450 n=1 Tax=Aquatica leii TaxID=1421715 RepID=A0AAN7PEH4_9COLE|nr:hypothetical protein RN001_006812 [Aquatica leii]